MEFNILFRCSCFLPHVSFFLSLHFSLIKRYFVDLFSKQPQKVLTAKWSIMKSAKTETTNHGKSIFQNPKLHAIYKITMKANKQHNMRHNRITWRRSRHRWLL